MSVAAKFWTLLEVIPNVALIVLLGFGAYAVGHGLVTIGTLAAFITMTLSLVWPVTAMGFLLSMTQEAMTAANRIAEIFDAPGEFDNGVQSDSAPRGRLELRDVGFRVPGDAGGRWLLRHVTLSLEPGETLALVGSTGAGKSLLTELLSRIHDVSEGRILLDGRDIRELSLSALRRLVCPLFEEPTVFSMSVAENLRLGGRRPATQNWSRRSSWPGHSSSTTCRSGSTRVSASRACGYPPGNGSGYASPGHWLPRRRY
ncbi:hypothetical protein NIIDMKKI_09670 [Mycobacterium kansasii]|uniref:ABC transmembrane type-1 domain-containing protein n=1 Tax=Mycobacterium kansasii TaxID=1768 RepID=A0A7G1I424_MYCKA|nr:hypothetical protein NIIDMKKI_09670 [Mycobacterium kansasii]